MEDTSCQAMYRYVTSISCCYLTHRRNMAYFKKGFLIDRGVGYLGSYIATFQLLNSYKKPSKDPKCLLAKRLRPLKEK